LTGEGATKRIPVTREVWESLSKLKRPGQTYDSLLEELIALKEEHDFQKYLKEIETSGDFISPDEAARELDIKNQ
jgi:predicted CopG family antitoxin